MNENVWDISMETKPIKYFKARLRFLTAEEGGRHSPILFSPGKYRPIFNFGDNNLYGGAFMVAPPVIEPGSEVEVEFVLVYDRELPFLAGDPIYVQEGHQRVASGKLVDKGIKQFLRSD